MGTYDDDVLDTEQMNDQSVVEEDELEYAEKDPFHEHVEQQQQLQQQQRQRRRRRLWLIPVVLLLIAICARHLSHSLPVPLFSFTDSSLPADSDRDGDMGFAHVNSNLALNPDTDPDAVRVGSAIHVHGRAGHHREVVHKRVPQTGDTSTPTSSSTPLETAAPSVPDTPLPVPTPFPQPFDETLSYNFTTTSCQTFFTNFTQSAPFRTCRPFSLLLSSSAEFLDAQANLTLLSSIIGGTCNTPTSLEQCESNMASYASSLQSACAADLGDRNALAIQALAGFKSYSMYRQAGCLRNQRTNAYCYPEAIAASSPSNAYYYVLGMGVPVPDDTTASCDPCLQSLMSVYAGALAKAGGGGLAIAGTYPRAAQLTNQVCGPTFAKVNPEAARAGSGEGRRRSVVGWTSVVMFCFTLGLGSFLALC